MTEYVEIVGAVVGLVYLFFEVKAHPLVWLFGVLMPLFYVFLYFRNGLFANAGINLYYIVASIYGLLVWKGVLRHGNAKDSDAMPIAAFPRRCWWWVAAVVAVLTIAVTWLLSHLDESRQPLLDGFTTAMSIVAMWMLAKKYYQQWLLWIITDPFTIVMCLRSGMAPTAVMYAVYLAASIYGYVGWRRQYRATTGHNNTEQP